MDAAGPPQRLIIASHNPGKVAEIEALLAPFAVEILSAASLNLPEPDETGASFAKNARLKAVAAATAAGLPALADDSGLAVTALEGRPGIYSARWAGPGKDFALAMQRVEEEMQGHSDRSAHFVSALCLAQADGTSRMFEGRIDGDLVWPPRGERGFGYDPMFLPKGHGETFGEMPPTLKHAMSHRARAFRLLVEQVFETAE